VDHKRNAVDQIYRLKNMRHNPASLKVYFLATTIT